MKGFMARLWVKAGPLLIEKHESPLIHAGRGLAKDRSRELPRGPTSASIPRLCAGNL